MADARKQTLAQQLLHELERTLGNAEVKLDQIERRVQVQISMARDLLEQEKSGLSFWRARVKEDAADAQFLKGEGDG